MLGVIKSGDKSISKILIEKNQNFFYSFTCIFPDYMGHEITKEFWKNSHSENMIPPPLLPGCFRVKKIPSVSELTLLPRRYLKSLRCHVRQSVTLKWKLWHSFTIGDFDPKYFTFTYRGSLSNANFGPGEKSY